jgi:hypothetical protein
VVLGVVVANRSGDHSRRTRTLRHSSEALDRPLRGSLGFVSIWFLKNDQRQIELQFSHWWSTSEIG